jgi:hypothetical protein
MCERQATAAVQKRLDAALEKLASYKGGQHGGDNMPEAVEE